MGINRHKARELAMQVLFLWDTHGINDPEMARQVTHDASSDPVLRQMAIDMANGAWEQRETADRWVGRVAPHWPVARQAAIDREILRLGVWELTNTSTPPKVVIDEAIELAKTFSTEQSAAFVNGVLDAILKEHRAITGAEALTREGAQDQSV
jgi:N utilization substance protein B